MMAKHNTSSKSSWPVTGCLICKKLIPKVDPNDPDPNRYCWCGVCQRCHCKPQANGILDHPIIWDDNRYDIISTETVVKIKVETNKQIKRRHKKEQEETDKINQKEFISNQMRGTRNINGFCR